MLLPWLLATAVVLVHGAVVPLLLVPTETGLHNLTVSEEGLAFLDSIPGPVSLVVTSGPFRTGKSFLLNQLLDQGEKRCGSVGRRREALSGASEQREGPRATTGSGTAQVPAVSSTVYRHRVGHAVAPVTMDVSVSVLMDPACTDGTTVLLLDTPGLDAPYRNAAWDPQIMALSLLMSSVMLYNNMRTIDLQSITVLARTTELASMYGGAGGSLGSRPKCWEDTLDTPVNAKGQHALDSVPSQTGASHPHLLWVVRDMELELQDSNGFPMSPTDYLKQSLQRADAVAFGLCSVNTTGCSVKSIPRLLCSAVSDVQAFTLPRPFVGRPDGPTTPAFDSGVDGLMSEILRLSKTPRLLAGRPITGRRLAAYLQAWVTAVNSAVLFPTLSVSEVTALLNERARGAAESFFRSSLSEVYNSMPLPTDRLLAQFETSVEAASEVLLSKAFGPLDVVTDLRTEVTTSMRGHLVTVRSTNERAVAAFIRPLVQDAVAVLERAMRTAVGTLPVDTALLAEAEGRAQTEALARLQPVEDRHLGAEVLDKCVVELAQARTALIRDLRSQNEALSLALCIAPIDEVDRALSTSLSLSSVMLIRTSKDAGDWIRDRVHSITVSCKGPKREEALSLLQIKADLWHSQLNAILEARFAFNTSVLNAALAVFAAIALTVWRKSRTLGDWGFFLLALGLTAFLILALLFEFQCPGVLIHWASSLLRFISTSISLLFEYRSLIAISIGVSALAKVLLPWLLSGKTQ